MEPILQKPDGPVRDCSGTSPRENWIRWTPSSGLGISGFRRGTGSNGSSVIGLASTASELMINIASAFGGRRTEHTMWRSRTTTEQAGGRS